MPERVLKYCVGILISLISWSCNSDQKKLPEYTDTATSGDVLIVCDESYQPLMQVQADTFMDLYTRAKIRIKFLPEQEMFREFMNNDSVRIAIAARRLSENDSVFFRNKKIFPKHLKIAVDAVAVILNAENADTLLTYKQLSNIITGKTKSWKEINQQNKGDSIVIVFDKNGSANVNYLKEKFLSGKLLPANSFASEGNQQIVDYVSQNKNALGLLSVSWISDKDSPNANAFLKKIKVAAIGAEEDGKWNGEYFKPYQGYIALKQYPLRRDIYIISREGRTGLGTGFASFVASDVGQRIVRLMGMLPATMPVRLVNVH